LRGLDLNQRPLGYEHGQPQLSVLESVAADSKNTVLCEFWYTICHRFCCIEQIMFLPLIH
jgi:hypothetical protein